MHRQGTDRHTGAKQNEQQEPDRCRNEHEQRIAVQTDGVHEADRHVLPLHPQPQYKWDRQLISKDDASS